MENKKPWSFCETPEENCTMNYCDDNGCQNRTRNYVQDNSIVNMFLTSPTPAKIEKEFKAYSVAWKCLKGHTNFQTIIGKEGMQYDICLKCGKHYEYNVG